MSTGGGPVRWRVSWSHGRGAGWDPVRAGVEAAGRVITVSNWVRQRIEPEAPAARYEVVPNIVDADETRSSAAGADDLEHRPAGTYLVAARKTRCDQGVRSDVVGSRRRGQLGPGDPRRLGPRELASSAAGRRARRRRRVPRLGRAPPIAPPHRRGQGFSPAERVERAAFHVCSSRRSLSAHR